MTGGEMDVLWLLLTTLLIASRENNPRVFATTRKNIDDTGMTRNRLLVLRVIVMKPRS